MKRLAYYPIVDTASQLTDIVSRAGWFLTFSPIEKIQILISDPALAELEWQVAPGMDPAIAERFETLRGIVELVPVAGPGELDQHLERAEIVLRWRHEEGPDRLAGKQVFEVDPAAVRQEGGNYIDVSFRLEPPAARAGQRTRFESVAGRIGSFERAFVLATGPSVGEYSKFDFDDSLAVVCNTVILDEQLMDAVRPQFVVFADPIFHFGPSQYAAKFRSDLRAAADRWDFQICIPAKYLAVFAAAVPELAERTVAVPFRKDRDFNFDLTADFEVKTTANVLTFLMLPLAATFAERIGILGCDGRPLDEDGYFWKHNAQTQLDDEKMANIRQVHPGFFEIAYNDYYLEHCETLAAQLDAGEAEGQTFAALAPSHIPALAERQAGPEQFRPRMAAPASAPAAGTSAGANGGEGALPRLLVVDVTRVNAPSATGQLKANLLADWPAGRFRQLYVADGRLALARGIDSPEQDARAVKATVLLEELDEFAPEVIYYRPTFDEAPELHSLAEMVIERHEVPLVSHVMDDWPTRLAAGDSEQAVEAEQHLREVFSRSQAALSISEKMSAVFGERYGVAFEPIANGVDQELWRAAGAAAAPVKERRKQVVIRYSGALARDMTFETVVDIARAVDELQAELPVRFEVYTRPPWIRHFRNAIDGLEGTVVLPSVEADSYPALLAEADVLVIAYNFDRASVDYVSLSMPNKLPECLASGAAVLAVGPREANGIDYLVKNELAAPVLSRDHDLLVAAIRRLVSESEHREALARRAQRWAFERMDLDHASSRFRQVLRDAAASSKGNGSSGARPPKPLLGPFPRSRGITVDEGDVIAELLDPQSRAGTMVDVGAHHGTALAPFAAAGWRVLACEPDCDNRAELVERIGTPANVTIDPRAVSDKPARSSTFYSSEQSTGISSLHAFHDSHRPSQTVEVTTVAELAERHGIESIDFLKIDVEGLDWNVIKGVPWERIRPAVIECEFEDGKTAELGYTYRDIADDLVAKGYSVYLSEWHPIIRYGIPHQWRQLSRYPAQPVGAESWGNLLAFRDDPGPERIERAFSACIKRIGRVPHPTADSVESSGRGARAGLPGPKQRSMSAQPSIKARFHRRVRGTGARAQPLLTFGRFAIWTARTARLNAGPAVLLAALLAALFVLGAIPALDPWGKIAWLVGGLLLLGALAAALAGFAGFLVAELRTATYEQYTADSDRLDRIESRYMSVNFETLEAKLNEIAVKQERATEALEAKLDEAVSGAEKLAGRLKEPPSAPTRQFVSLRVARSRPPVSFDGVVVLVAPQRSGSTWLFDLVRCHPAARLLPTAELYRRLEIRGRRFPMHLSDGPDATVDIEVQSGVGAAVPGFDTEATAVAGAELLAVEKAHPSAIRFDVLGFLDRVERFERAEGKPIRLCFLTRDPLDAYQSYLAYKERVPGWRGEVDRSITVPGLYRRSFQALVELARARPGPVVRYEELIAEPAPTVGELYGRLWPGSDGEQRLALAAAAVEQTRRERRAASQTGPFLTDTGGVPAAAGPLREESDQLDEEGQEAIDECRRLSRELDELSADAES